MMVMKKLVLVSVLAFSLPACTSEDKKIDESVTVKAAGARGAGGNDASSSNDFKVDDASGRIDFAAEVVYFEFDDATLTKEGMGQLDALAKYMASHRETKLNIEGNTDARGSVEYNLALGQRRSDAVKNYLTALGVPTGRLASISFGEEKPSAQGDGEAAWSKNRRAEFSFSK
jgi:peptidoglycan-associated lipoprotein